MPFPVITILQYTFYVGWMKVAGGLMNPFAEREDELESNFLIDKNFAVSIFSFFFFFFLLLLRQKRYLLFSCGPEMFDLSFADNALYC